MAKRRRRSNPGKTPPSYVESHWGKKPTLQASCPVQEPRDNAKLIGLGVLHSVVYVTKKGGDYGDVEYEHKFDESDAPLLAYGDKDGRLYIVGGGYTVEKHGIIK